MPHPNKLENRILNYGLTAGGRAGRTATWAELRLSIAEDTGDCYDDELRQAFVDLYSRHFITLEKWDEMKKCFRSFDQYKSMYDFFMRGSFRVTVTSEGCVHWEELLYRDSGLREPEYPGGGWSFPPAT